MMNQRKAKHNPHLTIAPDAVVCVEAMLEGEISIGSRCIVHPKATIIAKDGPIIIGEGNLIEEQSRIVNKNRDGDSGKSTLVIGDHNVFEVASDFEGKSVGSHNVLETKAKVGPCTRLSNGCVIGAACVVNSDEELSDNTVICGENYLRRTNRDKTQNQGQQLDFLKKILPNYHHLINTKKSY